MSKSWKSSSEYRGGIVMPAVLNGDMGMSAVLDVEDTLFTTATLHRAGREVDVIAIPID